MPIVNFITLVLLVIGALNWGAIGLANYNFINAIFGSSTPEDYSIFSRLIYTVIGIAGVWSFSFFAKCKSICCCRKSSNKNCEK